MNRMVQRVICFFHRQAMLSPDCQGDVLRCRSNIRRPKFAQGVQGDPIYVIIHLRSIWLVAKSSQSDWPRQRPIRHPVLQCTCVLAFFLLANLLFYCCVGVDADYFKPVHQGADFMCSTVPRSGQHLWRQPHRRAVDYSCQAEADGFAEQPVCDTQIEGGRVVPTFS